MGSSGKHLARCLRCRDVINLKFRIAYEGIKNEPARINLRFDIINHYRGMDFFVNANLETR